MNESMEKIDKYRILKRLGEGGFGAVYLCHDHDMERDVAIKVFRPRDVNLVAFATSSSEDGLQVLRERFKREARILARLHDNPYIVSALEFGETENGSPWYAMDYVPDNLQQRLGKDVFDRAGLEDLDQSAHPRALPLEQCLTLLHQILQGMKAAHAHGLVHRDIKPSNILLSDAGEVRIADFGIAKEPDTQISVSRVAMGSRNYMAPEQRESAKHVDRRADIYSIGVLAYRMLTGKLPTGRYADPEVVAPQLGKALNEVILKAFEEDKDKRFRDAGEMLESYEKARQQRAQEDEADSEVSYTVSSDEPVSEVPEKYRPLYDTIKETLLEHGAITPRQREIEATAAVLRIDGKGLKSIVADVTAAHEEISALQELLNLIECELEKLPAQTAGKETQAQTERLIGDLLPAAKLAGKDRAWLEARMQGTLEEQERSSPRTAPHTASKQAADSSYTEPAKRSFLLQASVVFSILRSIGSVVLSPIIAFALVVGIDAHVVFPILRSIGSVVLSLIIASALVVGMQGVLVAHADNYPILLLELLVFAGLGAIMFISTWLATRLGSGRHPAHGFGVGLFLFAMVVLQFSMVSAPLGFWFLNLVVLPFGMGFWVLNLVVLPFGMYFGTTLGRGRQLVSE